MFFKLRAPRSRSATGPSYLNPTLLQSLRNHSLLFWDDLKKIQHNVSWLQLTQVWVNVSLPNVTNLQVNVETLTLRSDIAREGPPNFWVDVAEGIKCFGEKIGDAFGISWEVVIICVCVCVFDSDLRCGAFTTRITCFEANFIYTR